VCVSQKLRATIWGLCKYRVVKICQSGSSANESMAQMAHHFNKKQLAVGANLYLSASKTDSLGASAAVKVDDCRGRPWRVELQTGVTRNEKNGYLHIDLPWHCAGLVEAMQVHEKEKYTRHLAKAEADTIALVRMYCQGTTPGGEGKALGGMIIELIHFAWGFTLRMPFVQKLHETLHEHGAILCVDECMSCGRTGPSFLLSQQLGTRTTAAGVFDWRP
jgi:4-aminobutyrate aminotransferase-like enzyme